jgi:glutathione S-transferase
MLTLYHCHDARSFRPLWTLEEMGLPYELKMLPFPPRAAADYLTVNPLGTVATFFDGNMRMTESAAICQYLVTRYGPTPLAVETSEPDFGPYLNWLYFGEATLTFPQTIVLRYSLFEPPVRVAIREECPIIELSNVCHASLPERHGHVLGTATPQC